MHIRLALVSAARPTGCTVRLLGEQGPVEARYSPAVQGRVKVRPRQLVAVDMAAETPTVLWRWFRGVVVYRQGTHVVVDNRRYQPAYRHPISVARLPEELEVEPGIGDEVFYSLGVDGVVIDGVADDGPAHPGRIAADLFPAIEDAYAEIRAGEGA